MKAKSVPSTLKPTSNQSTLISAKATMEAAESQIKAGLSKPTASTGTPVSSLHGAAKFTTQLSNIGGGSVDSGGGGIQEGFNTLTKYAAAKAVVASELRNSSGTKIKL